MRTLISFIGTGARLKDKSEREYKQAQYTLEEKEVGMSSFVQYGLEYFSKKTNKVRNNLAHNQRKKVNTIEANIRLIKDSQKQFKKILNS